MSGAASAVLDSARWAARLLLMLVLLGFCLVPGRAQAPSWLPPGYILLDDIWLPEEAVLGDGAYTATPWPGGVVFYQFAGSVGSSFRAKSRKAIVEVQAIANVTFYESPGIGNYIQVVHSLDPNVSSSALGMIGGVQNLAV